MVPASGLWCGERGRMKFFRSSLLVLGQSAALGWFILHKIPFYAVLPLVPIGLLYCKAFPVFKKTFILNGIFTAIVAVMTAYVTAVGLFGGRGLFSLICLTIALGLLGVHTKDTELERVLSWWLAVFLIVFTVMTLAMFSGIERTSSLPSMGNWRDILIFYGLALLEPLCLGKDYLCAPLALGIVLIPFSVLAYYTLGGGAFLMAQYPYLSVWRGVSVSAFHHIEGAILCFYYGIGAFRTAYFFSRFKSKISMQKVVF